MSKLIPDGWLDYDPYGETIKGTKILPFKVPLKEYISTKTNSKDRFTPAMLLKTFPHLKYIIDLTNTTRYYDKEEFIEAGIAYEKLMIPGHRIPDEGLMKRFFDIMDDFSSRCAEDEIIGVHCLHGINRTGYLICRYLVEKLGWKMDESLNEFEKARGYPIKSVEYMVSLRQM